MQVVKGTLCRLQRWVKRYGMKCVWRARLFCWDDCWLLPDKHETAFVRALHTDSNRQKVNCRYYNCCYYWFLYCWAKQSNFQWTVSDQSTTISTFAPFVLCAKCHCQQSVCIDSDMSNPIDVCVPGLWQWNSCRLRFFNK